MDNRLKTLFSSTAIRHYVRVVAFAVLVVSTVTFFTIVGYPFLKNSIGVINVTDESMDSTEPVPARSYTLSRSAPILLRIPKLDMETMFEKPLGLNPDKTIEVPDSFEQVGWYELGPSPGEKGPAIILGHVDSYQGAAVFYHLGQLEPGDEVSVDRVDGSTVTFIVDRLERYAQEEFPTERVYGMTDDAELRLITCTGTFNKGEQRYSHNLVVYAHLSEPYSGETATDEKPN